MRLPALLMCMLCAACTVGGTPTQAGQPLRIGVDLPLTGTESRAAVPALNGIRFYVQTHPALGGFSIELVTADDAGAGGGPASPERGVANVQRFLGDPRALAMIGPFDGAVAPRHDQPGGVDLPVFRVRSEGALEARRGGRLQRPPTLLEAWRAGGPTST